MHFPGGEGRYSEACPSALAAGGAGVLFWQGESESSTWANASTWASRFTAFVASLRRDSNDPTLPIVFAQLDTPTVDPAAVPYWSLVQRQQASVAIPNTAMITTCDLPTHGVHVTAAGYVTAGRRFATALLRLNPTLTARPIPTHALARRLTPPPIAKPEKGTTKAAIVRCAR